MLLMTAGEIFCFLTAMTSACLENYGETLRNGKVFGTDIDWKSNFVLHEGKIMNISLGFTWEMTTHLNFDGFLYSIRKNGKKVVPDKAKTGFKYNNTFACENIDDIRGKGLKRDELTMVCRERCFCHENFCMDAPELELLDKSARYIDVPAEFGEKYVFKLSAYGNFTLSTSISSYPASVFCLDQLIEKQKMNPKQLNGVCDGSLNGKYYPIGPVANLTLVGITYDIMNNKASAKFTWKEPYDIADGIEISWFCANYVGKCNGGGLKIEYMDSLHRKPDHYEVQVDGLAIGSFSHVFYIAAFYEDQFGRINPSFDAEFKYDISDVNACTSIHAPRYCDENARCKDLDTESDEPAICQCYRGFEGNGISRIYKGSGCVISCSMRDAENHTCVPNAECESRNQSIVCSCPRFTFGDGYRSGDGCTSVVYVVGSIGGLTLVSIFILVFVTRRRQKSRSLIRMSKFVEGSALGVGDGGIAFIDSGVFGKWEIDRKNIVIKDIIGRGSSGVVHKATFHNEKEKRMVAVKVVPDGVRHGEFLGEISVVISIQYHENILTVLGCCTSGSPTMLVTEYMEYGDLLHFLWDAREATRRKKDPIYNLTEKHVYLIGRQVARGMKYLTELKIIHGDIAARNILVGENLQCKISDFGLANDVYRYGMIKGAIEKRVPLKWISPERMMRGKVPITWRSDVWSCGILLYETVTLGGEPFPEIAPKDLLSSLEKGHRMSRPASCSEYLYGIMQRCWEWTPSKRPTFKELVDILKPENQGKIYVNLLFEINEHAYQTPQENME